MRAVQLLSKNNCVHCSGFSLWYHKGVLSRPLHLISSDLHMVNFQFLLRGGHMSACDVDLNGKSVFHVIFKTYIITSFLIVCFLLSGNIFFFWSGRADTGTFCIWSMLVELSRKVRWEKGKGESLGFLKIPRLKLLKMHWSGCS